MPLCAPNSQTWYFFKFKDLQFLTPNIPLYVDNFASQYKAAYFSEGDRIQITETYEEQTTSFQFLHTIELRCYE